MPLTAGIGKVAEPASGYNAISPSSLTAMKINRSLALILITLTSLSLWQGRFCRAGSASAPAAERGKLPAEPATEAKAELPAASPALSAAVKEFKADANDVTWSEVTKSLKTLLIDPQSGKALPAELIQSNPALADIGARTIEAGAAKLWAFPKITQSRSVLVQWPEPKAQLPVRRGRPAPAGFVLKVQQLAVPAGAVIKEARIIALPVPKEKGKLPEKEKKPRPAGGKFLVCAGSLAPVNSIWLQCYKLSDGLWKENAEPLSRIPPFLFNNLSGKLGFSGNDLVLTIIPSRTPSAPETGGAESKAAGPELSTYKLCLRLVDGKFALEGKVVEDTPYNAVFQFMQAVQQGRTDLAKAWLADTRLISIPRYLGLNGKVPATPYRMINMSSPSAGSYRYRLITFERNDLILDVGKPRAQWAVKAIFIAPADPLLQKIARSLPALEETSQGEAAEKGTDGMGAQPATTPGKRPGHPD